MEFTNLKLEKERNACKSTDTDTQFKVASQMKLIGKLRETNRGIKKLEKLITTVSNLLMAVQTMVCEVPEIQVVLLALGASPTHPRHVYEIHFTNKESIPMGVQKPSTEKKARADILSRKIIRELISNGAGCAGGYSGPAKLFLLVKAPASIKLPEAFLPKRDYTYSKKVKPFRVHITSCDGNEEHERSNQFYQVDTTINMDPQNVNPQSNDFIWFHCKHAVQGFACQVEHC
ncbi:uncharacterized protein LOC131052196 isoform X2 [Cryptomeria japonica]|nr:uncharacterized protein LOC131052196 isoform X2 [Cryptomeria japonica]